MPSTNPLNDDLKGIVATFFAVNVRGLLDQPSRLEAIAQMAGIPPERVPAIREALKRASICGLS